MADLEAPATVEPKGLADWIGIPAGLLVGLVCAFGTYALGRRLASAMMPSLSGES